MTRFSHLTSLFLLFFSLLCIPALSAALTVSISEVDPMWIPEASTKTVPSVAWATVTISDIDPNRDQYKVVQITLNKVTTNTGICCNSTDQDITDTDLAAVYKSGKDLIFRDKENSSWKVENNRTLRYQIPSANTPSTVTLSVGVLSLDYGGYGELVGALYKVKGLFGKAAFEFGKGSNKKKYTLQTEFSDDDDVIQVPRDKNENKIADSWRSDYYSPAYALTGDTRLLRDFDNKEDKDESIDKTYKGDHLTAFEEYRGFIVYSSNKPTSGRQKVKHTRTSPDVKDMFVVNEDSATNLYGTGTAPSQISPHLLPSSRVRASGWINFNEPNGFLAYSVKVMSNSIADPGENPTYGLADLGPPASEHNAIIYTGTIKYHEDGAHVGDVIRKTIGHELAHAAHLEHCPKADVKDANGKDKGWDKKCLMWPAHVSSQNEFASHHDVDYALAKPVQAPQTPVELDAQGSPLPKKGILVPSNGSYTAEAGDSHTANFTAPSAYSSVYWYVKTPSDTSAYGTTQEIDVGNGSTTTADFTYTFPSGVSGTYQIMAYVYGSDSSVYEEKYTVSVTAPSSSTTPTPTTPSLSYSLVSSDGVYTAEAGTGHEANFTTNQAYSSVYWYVKSPSQTGLGTNVETDTGDSSTTTTAQLSYSFPSGTSGDYVITAYVYPPASGSVYQTSYTVSVTTPSPTNTGGSSGGTLLGTLGSGTTTTVAAGETAYIGYLTQGGDCYNTIIWHVTPPGGSEVFGDYIYGYGTVNQANIQYTLPTDATAGTWVFRLEVSLYPSGWYEDTFTITVTD